MEMGDRGNGMAGVLGNLGKDYEESVVVEMGNSDTLGGAGNTVRVARALEQLGRCALKGRPELAPV
jgi:hypothetical protein